MALREAAWRELKRGGVVVLKKARDDLDVPLVSVELHAVITRTPACTRFVFFSRGKGRVRVRRVSASHTHNNYTLNALDGTTHTPHFAHTCHTHNSVRSSLMSPLLYD